ncbi:DUF2490 domain-containing protein [Candidatus Babeliales bacterium]|nr:DUF2490 domain-containing protein [Candidatus Babeliales bacterium]
MKKKILLITFFLFFNLHAEEGFEVWIGNSLNKPISEKTSYNFYHEMDFKKFIGEPYYYILDSSYIYKPLDKLSLSPTLRVGAIKTTNNFKKKWILEFSPIINVEYSFDVKEIEVYSHLKLMYRILQNQNSREVVRLKIGGKKVLKKSFAFFIDDEIFYNYNGFKKLDENRATFGLNFEVNQSFNLNLYYLRDDYKFAQGRSWSSSNVLGLSLNINFK